MTGMGREYCKQLTKSAIEGAKDALAELELPRGVVYDMVLKIKGEVFIKELL